MLQDIYEEKTPAGERSTTRLEQMEDSILLGIKINNRLPSLLAWDTQRK